MDLLWFPDVYIFNLQSIKKHSLIHDFDGLYFVNGTILYNVELEIAFYCHMAFETYPLGYDHLHFP